MKRKNHSRNKKKNYQKQPEEYPNCPICGKAVRNLNIAIEEKKSHEPAHFECIMKELSLEIKLGPQERLHYLGSGCFGIVKLEQGKGLSSFTITQRIQYEDKIKKPSWRKKLATTSSGPLGK